MQKLNLNNEDLIAPCGLYCGECSAFQDGRCGGCISRKGLCLKYTNICKIYSCCTSKHLRFCHQCPKFPCQKIVNFFNTKPWFQEVTGNLQKISRLGITKFLKAKVKTTEARIECAENHKISHCGNCPDWPCLKLKREPLTPA